MALLPCVCTPLAELIEVVLCTIWQNAIFTWLVPTVVMPVALLSNTVWYASTLDDEETFTTLEMKINFLRPFWSGTLVATARVVKAGRTIGLTECDVTDPEGRLIARAMSTCMTLRGDAREGR